MEADDDNVGQVVEADRLSSLPDDLICKILSSFDMKFVVQTCLLLSKWKLLWTNVTCLNFSRWVFKSSSNFDKFVTHVLSHRNHLAKVCSVKLKIRRSLNRVFVRKIINYAFSHNVQQLTVECPPQRDHELLPCLFNSTSLKHVTMTGCCNSLKTPLEFPALTTLHLSHIFPSLGNTQSLDLFSKCVNLKNLTLQHLFLSSVEVFHIITPRLSNLVIYNADSVKVINLVAPQLENLTLICCSISNMNAPPGLSSLCYRSYQPMQLCKGGFHNLYKAIICLDYAFLSTYRRHPREYKEEDARKTINMLQELHSARYLTVNVDIVECISSFPNLLFHQPSPFRNLKCMTLDSRLIFACYARKIKHEVKMSAEARNFFLGNSPNCKFIMDRDPGRGVFFCDCC